MSRRELHDSLYCDILGGTAQLGLGLAAVAVQKGSELKWGHIDKTGAWVIEPQYDMVHSFSEGLAAVMLLENDAATHGYIDKTGKAIWQAQ